METRDAKHEPRTLTEQKAAWLIQAGEVLGGPQAVQTMVHTALHPDPVAGTLVNARWVEGAAGRVLAAMEERRSTWQIWHVRAEAQRQVRAVELKAEQSERLVDLLVGDVLGNLSVSLARPNDGITEPAVLQRSDGTSVYTVAGSELFTSTRILDAEQRLVDTAGRYDGHTISPAAVDVALLQASRQRGRPERRAGRAGPPDGHLGGAAAAGDRARRRRQNHRDADPRRRLDRSRRHCDRAGAVSGRRGAAPRPDRRSRRHPRQTHLVRRPARPARLGPQDWAVDPGGDRRGRDGRHPVP